MLKMRFRGVGRGVIISTCAVLAAVVVAQSGCSNSSPTPDSPEARLQKDTGVPWTVDQNPRTGVPDLVAPTDDDPTVWLKPGVTPEDAARAFITKYKDIWQLRDPATELAVRDVDIDEDGMTHVLFDQTNGGVPVFGAGLLVHFGDDGTMGYVNGDYFPKLDDAQHTPGIDGAAAIAAAIADAGQKFKPSAVAPIAELGFDGYYGSPRLVWRVRLGGTIGKKPVGRYVMVDAQTSAVVGKVGLVFEVSASGTGSDGKTRSFEVTANADKKSWTMAWPKGSSATAVQTQRYAVVAAPPGTLDACKQPVTSVATGAPITSTDLKSWDPIDAAAMGYGAAVDVHANAHLVDQFYRQKEQRASYDGKGSPLVITVHDPVGLNAFWSFETNDMHYGDGDSTSNAVTTLDVTGHEITHGFTQYTSKLAYHFQPGALNESISDIFGTLIEHTYAKGGGNFLIGEGIMKNGDVFRDMQHPSKWGQPDHMQALQKLENHCEDAAACDGTPDTRGDTDCGGVHINSGIPNNAFYLMVMGGANDTSKLSVPKPIGWDGARRVWWQSERHALSAESDFSQAARAQIASAKKLHVNRDGVACAWVATGVVDADYVKKYKITCGCTAEAGTTVCCDPDGGTDGGDQCCVTCTPEAGPADDGGAMAQDASEDINLVDSCAGRADGLYCQTSDTAGAIQCMGQVISGGLQCANGQHCVGPNGPGTMIQCQ